MEIQFEGAHHSSGFIPLVREAPISAHFDGKNGLVLEPNDVRMYQKRGDYNIHITFTPEDIGKIVAEFYKQAVNKK